MSKIFVLKGERKEAKITNNIYIKASKRNCTKERITNPISWSWKPEQNMDSLTKTKCSSVISRDGKEA